MVEHTPVVRNDGGKRGVAREIDQEIAALHIEGRGLIDDHSEVQWQQGLPEN